MKTHNKEINLANLRKDTLQSRSKFQLKHFVVGQHHSPEMQYHQLVLESSSLENSIQENLLNIKKLRAEADELRITGKKSDSVEAELKDFQADRVQETISSSIKELEYLLELLETYPEYTREQIEEAQKDYWQERLTRVAQLQLLGAQAGVNYAQLEALQQAGVIEEAVSELSSFKYITNDFAKLESREQNND